MKLPLRRWRAHWLMTLAAVVVMEGVANGSSWTAAGSRAVADNRPPTAVIMSPANEARYSAGDTIRFSGIGSDPEDGALPGAAMTWRVDLHNGDDIRPVQAGLTGSGGSIVVPTRGDNGPFTWYRIQLTVTDSSGQSDRQFVDIYPNLVQVSWLANYPDAQFMVNGVTRTGSWSELALVGSARSLRVSSPQAVEGGQYRFTAWSDGGDQDHQIVVPSTDIVYEATFNKTLNPPPPWRADDIGGPKATGYTAYDGGTYRLNGSGRDIWGTVDEFHYLHQDLSGDGEIVARMTAQDPADDWAKAGVMIKGAAVAGSPYVLLAATPGHGLVFQHGFSKNTVAGNYVLPNTWLKLERTAGVIRGYVSADGVTWWEAGSATGVPMAAEIGLFVTSHNTSKLNNAVFDNVRVNP